MAESAQPPEPETNELPTPASPAAVALAIGRASQDDETVDGGAIRFLCEHTRMLGMQMEHLQEQRLLNAEGRGSPKNEAETMIRSCSAARQAAALGDKAT